MSATRPNAESWRQAVARPSGRTEATTSLLGRIDRVWAGCALVAAVAVLVAAFMPLWHMVLLAPQYPGGIEVVAFGTRMEGNLREVNALNHYVGIQAIQPDQLFELKLFPFAIGALVLLILAGALFARRRRYQLLLALAVWGVPAGLLVDLQWWLYRYGHNLAPDAPFRLEPFTPKVLGTTTVINFQSETMVASGFWVMVLAGLILAAGPSAVRFVRDSWNNTGDGAKAATVALLLVAGFTLARPDGVASAADEPLSLAAAIEAAAPGDTLTVPAGTYAGPVVIDKPLTLAGEPGAVLDGGGVGHVVEVTAEDVTVRGFVIRNSGRSVSDEPSGIRVRADRATIEDNRLEDVLYGIALHESNGHVVRNNDVRSIVDLLPERRGHAIYLWYSTDNLISGNTLQLAKDGIFLGFAQRTVVERNTVTRLRYGLHTMYATDLTLRENTFRNNIAGASLMYSRGLTVVDNEFSGNRSIASGYGLLFKDMDDVHLVGNRIYDNRLGMTMEGAPRTPGAFVTIERNLIASNQTAIELFSTTDASFIENSFVGNLQQVESRGGSLSERNHWALDGRGNYWDEYQGFDADGDGVGDVPYRYEGAYDDLLRRSEAVRAYAFTPARSALDLAARWFPVYRMEPRVVDPYPLMRPTISLAPASAEQVPLMPALTSLLLVAGAGAVFLIALRTRGKRWTTC